MSLDLSSIRGAISCSYHTRGPSFGLLFFFRSGHAPADHGPDRPSQMIAQLTPGGLPARPWTYLCRGHYNDDGKVTRVGLAAGPWGALERLALAPAKRMIPLPPSAARRLIFAETAATIWTHICFPPETVDAKMCLIPKEGPVNGSCWGSTLSMKGSIIECPLEYRSSIRAFTIPYSALPTR